MHSPSGSNFVDNATRIRLNAARGYPSEEPAAQVEALTEGTAQSMPTERTDITSVTGDDIVFVAGC